MDKDGWLNLAELDALKKASDTALLNRNWPPPGVGPKTLERLLALGLLKPIGKNHFAATGTGKAALRTGRCER